MLTQFWKWLRFFSRHVMYQQDTVKKPNTTVLWNSVTHLHPHGGSASATLAVFRSSLHLGTDGQFLSKPYADFIHVGNLAFTPSCLYFWLCFWYVLYFRCFLLRSQRFNFGYCGLAACFMYHDPEEPGIHYCNIETFWKTGRLSSGYLLTAVPVSAELWVSCACCLLSLKDGVEEGAVVPAKMETAVSNNSLDWRPGAAGKSTFCAEKRPWV